jgi:serine/threonine protein kinase/DNA-binding winged helix-turn-helix (wHTH) protein/tetratricopeptide (TPR) repeat protein
MPPDLIRFADNLELDRRAYELRRSGEPLKLSRIPMELLLLLVERRGELVTRDEIVGRIWGKDVFLDTDNSINAAIRKLRQVLVDDPEKPQFIQTITGMGYRFIAAVMEVSLPEPVLGAVVPVVVKEPLREDGYLLGKKVSHYRILQLLGGGGMGVVYSAEDLKLGRKVAIKFLPAEMASDAKALERLEGEARAASALEHPNICPIYELGEDEGQPFIVMQLLEGQTLQERIESAEPRKSLPVNEVLDLALQITAGLEAAHEKCIIHRDIKPANIFITRRGEAKILDFGLARPLDDSELLNIASKEEAALNSSPSAAFFSSRLTRTGTLIGTVHYMSPEQVRGETLDARTDLFSFGLVLYEMATGQRAFPGNTASVVHDGILHQQALPGRQVNPELPVELEQIITKALEKDRTLRYQSVTEARGDLQRVKRDSRSVPLSAVTSGPAAAVTARAVQLATFWKIVVPVLLVTTLIGGWFHYRSRQTKPLTDKDTIVLADFANGTGDGVFDDTLKQALSVALNQSPFLNVLSENKVAATLQMMSRLTGTKLTPDVARELCQRAGSKAYIAGSIASLGSQYVLGLKAENCQSGDLLAQEQVAASAKEKVLDALGEAAAKLRGELGESLATVQKFDVPLAEATTSSLEALKAYSLGNKAYREESSAAALPYHQHAIQLDPGFAMGYRALGDDYFGLGELERASEYFTKAFELREHTSEWEKLLITANYYSYVSGELDRAVQTYQEWMESYPRNYRAHLDLGNVYTSRGQYQMAAEAYRESLLLAPDNVDPYDDLVNSLLALQRFDEAREVIQQAPARKLDSDLLHNALYGLAFLRADSPAMAEQQRWFAGKPEFENEGLSLESDTEAYAGHLSKAQGLTKRSVDSAIRADSKENGAIWQENAALREAAFGNDPETRQAVAEGVKLAPKSQGVDVEAALALAIAGDTARAESMARDLNKRFPLDAQMQALWLSAIRAQLALDRKDPAGALNDLEVAGPIELGQISFVANISCLYPTYVRGEAYVAAGQASAAAAEFQKIIDHSGIVWNCWTGALAHLGLARAHALKSRKSQGADAAAARVRALSAYKDFLTLWKEADPDIPILKQAKAEYAKLQ